MPETEVWNKYKIMECKWYKERGPEQGKQTGAAPDLNARLKSAWDRELLDFVNSG